MPRKPKGSPEKRKNGKAQTKKNPNAAGRAEKVLDWRLINELCKIQCTMKEIAGAIDCDEDTLDKHSKKTHGVKFSVYREQKAEGGKASLRRKQWKTACDEGSVTMQIWLGKNYLGQSDNNETKLTLEEGFGFVKNKGDA